MHIPWQVTTAASLGDGMLTTNLGIPIIVVGTQSDQLKVI